MYLVSTTIIWHFIDQMINQLRNWIHWILAFDRVWLKGCSTYFTYKGQFTRHGGYYSSVMMSCGSLGALYASRLSQLGVETFERKPALQTGGMEFETWAFTRKECLRDAVGCMVGNAGCGESQKKVYAWNRCKKGPLSCLSSPKMLLFVPSLSVTCECTQNLHGQILERIFSVNYTL